MDHWIVYCTKKAFGWKLKVKEEKDIWKILKMPPLNDDNALVAQENINNNNNNGTNSNPARTSSAVSFAKTFLFFLDFL